jgi:aquaporin rerated protein, other eukaryote
LLIFKMPFRDRIPIFSIESPQQSRLPMLGLPDTIRNNIIAVVGEFVGTFLFLFWAFVGAQIASTPVPPPGADPRLNVLVLLYISMSFTVSLTANVWIFYRISGGLFNPSV